jgi:hypothetical protein
MSLQARCKCGWNGPVSEVYLNGHIQCPDCGENIDVKQPSTPYTYPPFTTWESQRPKPVNLPTPVASGARRTYCARGTGCESWNVLALGIGALVLSFGHFSWPAALVLAMCALAAGWRSRSLAAAQHRRRPAKATIGMIAAITALTIGMTGALGGAIGCRHARSARDSVKAVAAPVATQRPERCRKPAQLQPQFIQDEQPATTEPATAK